MKNIYLKIYFLLFSFILQLYLPARLEAQCAPCAGGIPPTELSYLQIVPPSQSSNTIFSFPKFDPSVGTLTCIRFDDTVNILVTTIARNTDTTDGHTYKFLTTIGADIKGPKSTGLFSWTATHADSSTTYGPLYLEKDSTPRLPGDSIAIGPEALINNAIGSAAPPDKAPFLGGVGTFVNFSMELSGGALASSGGTNYTAGIRSSAWGSFKLSYYYCPLSLLASGLQNFSALKKDNNILLKWDAQNSADIDQYDIEYSLDGISFTSVAKIEGNHKSTESTYNYNYALNGNSSGYVYFRIKQTGNTSAYSAIQKVLLSDKTTVGVSIHPNPVTTGMSIAFDQQLNGDYSVDLVNLSGQVVVNKKVRLINSNIIPITWNNKPAPGIYFTRIVNTSTMEQQIARIIIQ